MKVSKLTRRVWVTYFTGAAFTLVYLLVYLQNETTVRSRMGGVAIALGVMAVGSAIGLWLDVRLTRWMADRRIRAADAEPTTRSTVQARPHA